MNGVSPAASARATPTGNAALAIRQVLLNNGCSIPLAVAREAAEAAAPHLASTAVMEAAVKLAELLAPAMSADPDAGADGQWTVQNVIDNALIRGLAELERRYLSR